LPFVPCAVLFLSLSLSDAAWGDAAGAASCPDDGAGLDELSLFGVGCAADGAGFDSGGLCCADTAWDAKKRKPKNTETTMNGWVTNFIDKRFSKKASRLRRVILILTVRLAVAPAPTAALHWFTNGGGLRAARSS
jgi:hypothetical protein